MNISEIKLILKKYNSTHLDSKFLKKSAVLILINKTEKNYENYEIIMTARSSKLRNHTGEMSFPGGRFDQKLDNNLKETALRETKEEIGIFAKNIKIIGSLDDFATLTGYIIRPFVGLILNNNKKKLFNLNHAEVSHLVKIPIDFLKKKNIFNETFYKNKKGKGIILLNFDFFNKKLNKKFHIWGASAHILSEYLKIVHNLQVCSSNYKRPDKKKIEEYIKKKTRKRKKKKDLKP